MPVVAFRSTLMQLQPQIPLKSGPSEIPGVKPLYLFAFILHSHLPQNEGSAGIC